MRTILKSLLWIFVILPLALGLLLFIALFSAQPLLTPTAQANGQQNGFTDILRKQQRELRFGNPVITISDKDINTLISHTLQQSRFKQRANALISLDDNVGQLQLTLDSRFPIQPYLNFAVNFHVSGRQPIIDSMRIGKLTIPDSLSNKLLALAGEGLVQTRAGATWQRLFDAIELIDINDNEISVHYGLEHAKPPQLVDAEGNNLLMIYQLALVNAFPQGGKIPLASAMQQLFMLAEQRSNNGSDPVLENTAILVALGLQVAPENLLELFGIPEKRTGNYSFSIERQRDLGKHFLTSAFLTIYGGKQLSNLAGTYKELVDLQLRQEFDVRDLTANQAGIRFALSATNPAIAKQLQSLMARTNDEHYAIPETKSFSDDVKLQLHNAANNQQGNLQRTVRRKVGEFIDRAPLYQDLLSLTRQ